MDGKRSLWCGLCRLARITGRGLPGTPSGKRIPLGLLTCGDGTKHAYRLRSALPFLSRAIPSEHGVQCQPNPVAMPDS